MMYYLNLEKFLNQPDADPKTMLAQASNVSTTNLITDEGFYIYIKQVQLLPSASWTHFIAF